MTFVVDRRQSARDRLIAAGVVSAAFLWAYYSTFRKLVDYWGSNDMYSYGFLVPVIIGYLVWLRRDELRAVPVVPSFGYGTVVLVAGLMALTIGRVSNTNLLEELSLPVTATGATMLVLGLRMTRELAFPLAYTLAMIPFWGFLTDPLQAPFQLYSAVVGVGALRLFDIPVLREGVFIYLPDATLEVADVCSGINQLVAILCIGVPLAHLNISRWSKRAIVVAAALVIALLSNGLRVAMVSLFAYHGIRGANGDVHGPYSLARTTLISAIGFLILFWLIARFSDRQLGAGEGVQAHSEPASANPAVRKRAVIAAVVLIVAAATFERWHQVTPIPLRDDLSTFPRVVAGWHVVAETPYSAAVTAARFDKSLSRRYAAPDGAEVDLLVGYFERQSAGRELVGYEIGRLLSRRGVPATRTLNGDNQVKDFVTTTNGQRYLVTYWYRLDGRTLSGNYETKMWSTWNALIRGRSNGGIVLVRTRIDAQQSLDAARSTTRNFIEGTMAASGRLLPS